VKDGLPFKHGVYIEDSCIFLLSNSTTSLYHDSLRLHQSTAASHLFQRMAAQPDIKGHRSAGAPSNMFKSSASLLSAATSTVCSREHTQQPVYCLQSSITRSYNALAISTRFDRLKFERGNSWWTLVQTMDQETGPSRLVEC
jgi:hypothetical protein